MWLVFFAVALTVSAAMPLLAAVPLRLPVTDTILSWSRSLKDREPTPPQSASLTLTPAATDTMLVCTSDAALTEPASRFLLPVISELNLLVTLLMDSAAPAALVFPSEISTATFTIVLPAAVPVPSLFAVSLLRYPSPVESTLRAFRYSLY